MKLSTKTRCALGRLRFITEVSTELTSPIQAAVEKPLHLEPGDNEALRLAEVDLLLAVAVAGAARAGGRHHHGRRARWLRRACGTAFEP